MYSNTKPYPYTAFRFRVEADGITVAMVSEVTGLQAETEAEPYEEGGVNDFVYQLPKRTKYQNMTLKRGITDATDLWDWYQDVVDGKVVRKALGIILIDWAGKDAWRWNVREAYPIKWAGSELKAEQGTVFFETITIAHHGIRKG